MHTKEAKGILSQNNGMNIYRGCTHGCIYCDSRSTCYQIKHDFEDVEVKINAPLLLEKALKSKRKKAMIGTGAMGDPYVHCEEELMVTRRCLEIIEKYDFGLAIQTKSDRILRDLDILKKINGKTKCVVQITLTTYDEKLCRILEPNVSTSKERFEVLKIMKENAIPTVVWLGPILPFINDSISNLNGIMDYCIEAGVKGIVCFGFGMTLREGNREYYYEKLDKNFPGLKNQYIRSFGESYQIGCKNSDKLYQRFKYLCQENKILYKPNEVFDYMKTYETSVIPSQLSMFD